MYCPTYEANILDFVTKPDDPEGAKLVALFYF